MRNQTESHDNHSMKKAVVHFEIGCSNISETAAFYQKVFDWQVTPNGSTASIDTGIADSLPGHINQLGPDDPQNYITIYIETDTIEADLLSIEANGGKKFVGPLPLPDGRQFAWFQDVAGNIMGLISASADD